VLSLTSLKYEVMRCVTANHENEDVVMLVIQAVSLDKREVSKSKQLLTLCNDNNISTIKTTTTTLSKLLHAFKRTGRTTKSKRRVEIAFALLLVEKNHSSALQKIRNALVG